MMKSRLAVFLLLITAPVILLSATVIAQSQLPPSCQEGSLPSGDPKYPADQLIFVCIPANWNGALVVYAHGFVPPQFPLALPLAELTSSDVTFVPQIFLSQGFAFATSSYHKNGAVTQQGANDLAQLVDHFRSLRPHRSSQKGFLIGASEGGLVVMQLIERHPRRYDGALALCAPVGGAPEQIRYAGDFRIVFDYFSPAVFPFGAADVPPDAFRLGECLRAADH